MMPHSSCSPNSWRLLVANEAALRQSYRKAKSPAPLDNRGTRRAVECCGARRGVAPVRIRIYVLLLNDTPTMTCGLGWSTSQGRSRSTGSRQAGNRAAETLPDAAKARYGPRRISLSRGRETLRTGSPVTLCPHATSTSPDPGRTGASASFSARRF